MACVSFRGGENVDIRRTGSYTTEQAFRPSVRIMFASERLFLVLDISIISR